MSEQVEYWASIDGVRFNYGPYASPEEGCAAQRRYGSHAPWWIGRRENVTAQQLWRVDAEWAIERIGLAAEEKAGEAAEDYGHQSTNLRDAFQAELDKAVERFLKKHGKDVEPTFFCIIDVEKYPKRKKER